MTEEKKTGRKFPLALLLVVIILSGFIQVTAVILVGTVFTYQVSSAIRSHGVITESDFEDPTDKTSFLSTAAEKKLKKIEDILQSEYLFDNLNTADYETYLIKGYVDALDDPYTVYYTPDEYSDLNDDMNGTYSGIGVVVQQEVDTGRIKVVRPYKNAPGAEAGMKTGDIIMKVNGEEVTGVDLELVVGDIRGEEGTTVEIQVYRPLTGEYLDLTVERRKLNMEYVTYEMLDHNIGYIEMTSFAEVTYDQFMNAFRDLQSQGMTSLIIDIRDNGGGLLSSVCDILNELLPEGIITYTEDRDGYREEYRSSKKCILDIPTLVLVNGNSASASEIFTGAMQDYHKATIMGTQTFGKGIVQSIYPLGDGSALKVTISRYFTPNGVCIHGVGIEPDEIVEQDYQTEEDEQLDAAIDYLLNSVEN